LWDQIKPNFQGTLFEKCCHYWASSCSVLRQYADVIVRLEDLVRSIESRKTLLNSLDIEFCDKPFPLKNESNFFVSGYDSWSAVEKEQFEKICGKQMEIYYPNWQKNREAYN